MDNGTEFTVERLARGSVINAHSFLVRRPMPVHARFAVNTTFYSLTAKDFGDIAADNHEEYPMLEQAYNLVYSEALSAKERQDDGLDYSPGRL